MDPVRFPSLINELPIEDANIHTMAEELLYLELNLFQRAVGGQSIERFIPQENRSIPEREGSVSSDLYDGESEGLDPLPREWSRWYSHDSADSFSSEIDEVVLPSDSIPIIAGRFEFLGDFNPLETDELDIGYRGNGLEQLEMSDDLVYTTGRRDFEEDRLAPLDERAERDIPREVHERAVSQIEEFIAEHRGERIDQDLLPGLVHAVIEATKGIVINIGPEAVRTSELSGVLNRIREVQRTEERRIRDEQS